MHIVHHKQNSDDRIGLIGNRQLPTVEDHGAITNPMQIRSVEFVHGRTEKFSPRPGIMAGSRTNVGDVTPWWNPGANSVGQVSGTAIHQPVETSFHMLISSS